MGVILESDTQRCLLIFMIMMVNFMIETVCQAMVICDKVLILILTFTSFSTLA